MSYAISQGTICLCPTAVGAAELLVMPLLRTRSSLLILGHARWSVLHGTSFPQSGTVLCWNHGSMPLLQPLGLCLQHCHCRGTLAVGLSLSDRWATRLTLGAVQIQEVTQQKCAAPDSGSVVQALTLAVASLRQSPATRQRLFDSESVLQLPTDRPYTCMLMRVRTYAHEK
jgi:hypothetical protein